MSQTEFARLPRMTDPLGKHWGQPKELRERVEIYETHATINEKDWQALPRYDSSMPSGVYAGKVWRRGKWLVWYGKPHMVPGLHGELKEVCTVGRARALVTA